jgi:hypothetical protein
MKGFKTAVIIIAVLLIVIGGAICFFGMTSINFDFDKLATNEAVTKEYTAEGEFDRIYVESILSGIKLVISEDDTCRVTYSDTRKLPLSISVEGGELKVVQKDERKWYERIGIFTTKTEIVIYLPKAEYESLGVCNTVGDLYVQSGFTFGSASVDATTGDVEFNASVKGDLNVNATTGDVEIGGKNISVGIQNLAALGVNLSLYGKLIQHNGLIIIVHLQLIVGKMRNNNCSNPNKYRKDHRQTEHRLPIDSVYSFFHSVPIPFAAMKPL